MFEVMARGMALPEILRTSGIGCDIAPSSLGLQTLDMEMSTNNHRVYLLRDALMSLSAAYDFIVIDTPPSMNLLTYNALQASGEVVVPMLCEPFSLRGMGRLLRIIREFQHPARNPILQLSAVVPCRYDKRKRLTQQALDMIEGLIPSGTPVCIIRDNIAVSEASGLQRDIYTYAPTSNGAEDYDALTQVMMQQHEAKVARILNAYTHRRDPSNSGQMTQYLAG
jgi:chromosome partitioning protein